MPLDLTLSEIIKTVNNCECGNLPYVGFTKNPNVEIYCSRCRISVSDILAWKAVIKWNKLTKGIK